MRLAVITAILGLGSFVSPVQSQPGSPRVRLEELIEPGALEDLRWPGFSRLQPSISAFYQSSGYQLAWFRGEVPTPRALELIRSLEASANDGLDPENYDGSRWQPRLKRLAGTQPSSEDLIRFDLALTISAMRYISDLHSGRVIPREFCPGYDVQADPCDPVAALNQLRSAADLARAIEAFEPPYEGYRNAKKALRNYIRLAQEDDGELLPVPVKPVDPGMAYTGVKRLERLLRRVGDLPISDSPPPGSQIYEGVLVQALKRFQTRHGLEPDGRLGPTTFKQLNTPLSRRLRQLQLVLERWRWVPSHFSRPPLVVNIPEFRLYAFNERYRPELEMKVVVGSAYRRQTPVFTDTMTHVIFRPYWNVPLSIQRGELVPKIRKDPKYLAANDYEVTDAQGRLVPSDQVTSEFIARLRSGKLQIRQVPGLKNALGSIKFLFPNSFNVYMHGTPARALFSKSRRDFSHGCIRVEKPEDLALWVLKGKPDWDLDRILAAENGAKPLQVNLDQPIPVLIVYATAVARETGEVGFYEDIYGHDRKLEELLAQGYERPSPPSTSGERVLHPHE